VDGLFSGSGGLLGVLLRRLDTNGGEAASHPVVLLCGGARLFADDGVLRDHGPLVPAIEGDLKVVAESGPYGFRAGTDEHGAKDGDRLLRRSRVPRADMTASSDSSSYRVRSTRGQAVPSAHSSTNSSAPSSSATRNVMGPDAASAARLRKGPLVVDFCR